MVGERGHDVETSPGQRRLGVEHLDLDTAPARVPLLHDAELLFRLVETFRLASTFFSAAWSVSAAWFTALAICWRAKTPARSPAPLVPGPSRWRSHA